MTSRLWLAASVVLALWAFPPAAAAWYGDGAQIVSADFGRLEQGDDASQFAAVAAGGRYVAIQTRARNFFADDDPDPAGQVRVGGIFRFDRDTRSLELVADGDFRDEATGDLLVRGAQSPSISADGRFVAFSTGQQLVPADVNGNVDVYVRDMSLPIRAPAAFELVSARDGGDVAASYAPRDPDLPGRNPGAEVSRGTAISADGSRVVFRTLELASDLPAAGGLDTPGFQIFVRDRSAHTTTLVTRASGSSVPAGGAVGPAAISGDGTTVVWTGQNAPAQTRFVNGENPDPSFYYYLWQRIADGPSAPARRITGAADPDDPGCPPSASAVFDQTSTGPCYGPLTGPELAASNFNLAAAISADGRTLAFLTSAGPRPDPNTQPGLDLYVTRMDPGLTRKAATTELTREGAIGDAEASSPIESVAISADGRWLALTSSRTRFVLPALSQLGSPRLAAAVRELYAVSLDARTVERVTRSIADGDIDGSVANEPTLSGDGAQIAFTAFASNLFFGDANEKADAFVADRQAAAGGPGPPPTSGGAGSDDRTEDLGGDELPLPTSVRQLRGGALELRVRVPAAGTLTAVARGKVARSRRGTPATYVLARANAFSPRAGRVTVRLTVVRRYRGQLRAKHQLPTRVGLTFFPSRGGRRVTHSLRTSFRAKAPKRARRASFP
jgi:Tol biopolymer transport system component